MKRITAALLQLNCIRKAWLAICMILLAQASYSQNLSNKGTDFWVAYGLHQFAEFGGSNAQEMILYFSAEQDANVTVRINGTAWVRNYFVPANSVITSDLIPKSGVNSATLVDLAPPAGNGGDGLFNKGINITSDVPIVAYAHIYGQTNSGASMLMPVNTWGYSYVSINSRQRYAANCYSFAYVIADHDNTVVQITPSVLTRDGKPAGVPFTAILNRGDVYQVVANHTAGANLAPDLSGTTFRSIANSAGVCYPVAVFSGSSRTNNPFDGCGGGGGDNDNQQLFPTQAWGKRYLTAPTSASTAPGTFMRNAYKICVKDPTTQVYRNNVLLTGLTNGHYYVESNTADYITSDKPVMVIQFMSGGACAGGGLGDPEMIIISPVEQGIKSIGFFRNNRESIQVNYLTMIVPNGGTGLSSLTIDGIPATSLPAAACNIYPHPRLPGYSVVVRRWSAFAAFPAPPPGQCLVRSDSAFTAITYGLGGAESYGYNAGTQINNLNAISALHNTLAGGTAVHEFTCKNTPVEISALMAYPPTRMEWKLSALAAVVTPSADVIDNAPTSVGTVVINGITYYKYTLPGTYMFNAAGTYELPILATHPSVEACNNTEELKIKIEVKQKPISDFTITPTAVCELDTVYLHSIVNTSDGYTIQSWNWSFPGGSTATGRDTLHLFAPGAAQQIQLSTVTTEGCRSDTIKRVDVYGKPTADFTFAPAVVCRNGTVTFTPTQSYAGTPVASAWYWDFGNTLTQNATTGNPVTSIYDVAPGNYNVKLVYKTSPTCISDTAVHAITVATAPAKPLATSPVFFCQNATATPLTATPLAGHTLMWYNNSALTGGSATAPTPSTTTPGTTYYYVTQTGGPNNCTSDTTRIAVTITNGITGNTVGADQTVCSGTAPAALNGTGTVAGGSGTYTYQWQESTDGGATWQNVSAATNATFTPPAVTGAVIYRRVVSDGSCTATSNNVTITIIGSMGSFNIAANHSVCAGATPNLLDGQTPTGGNGTFTFVWESSTDGGTTWGPVGATTEDYQPPLLTATTQYRRRTTSGICTSLSNVVIVTVNPLPNGTITGPTGICSYDAGSINFTANAGTGPYTIQIGITGPTTNTINQTVPSNAPFAITVLPAGAAAGTYTISINSITDANCTRTTGFTSITIVVTAQPTVTVTPPSSGLCAGSSVSLTASGATTYAWTPATGLSATTGATVTASPAASQTYQVIGTTNGCASTAVQVPITVNPVPAAPTVPAATVSYCQNATAATLTATATAGNNLTWYTTPALTGGSAIAPTPSTSTAGTTTHYVTQTSITGGCRSTATTITVTVIPAIANNTVSAAQTICSGATPTALSSTTQTGGTGSYTYQWQQSINGGTTWTNITGATSSTYSPAALTVTTQYQLIVTSGLCTSTSNAVTITVIPPMTNYNIASSQTICAGNTPALLDGQTTAGPSAVTYVWESSTDGGTTWAPIGVTTEDYLPPAPSATIRYRRKSVSGPCTVTSNEVIITVNPVPTTAITGPTAICSYDAASISFVSLTGAAPFTVQLSINGPGGPSTITQTLATNTPAPIQVIPANSAAGTYTIVITSLTDNVGCPRTTGFTPLTITVNPRPTVTVNTPAPICAGSSATLNASGATSYAWSPATGLSATTGATVTANPATTTTYQIIGTSNSCNSTPVSVTVTVNPIPASPVVNANVRYCQNDPATALTATALGGHTLTWYNNPGLTGGSTTAPVPVTTTVGSVTYYVTQTNAASGCRSVASTITVRTNPVPVADFTVPTKICLPGGATFTNTSTISDNSTLSYVWDFGHNSATSTVANPTYNYPSVGSYTVILAATSAEGCVDVSDPKTVSDFYNKPVAVFTVTPNEICQGANTIFTDQSTSLPTGTITSWSWTFGDGTSSTQQTPTKKYDDPGNYTVRLTVTNSAGCTSDPTPLAVTVHLQPQIDAGRSFVVPQGTVVNFEATANSPLLTFSWNPATDLSDATVLRPSLTANADQQYILTATGEFNCQATDSLTVKILRPITIPNVFSPNGDGIHDTWRIPNLLDYPGCSVEIFNRYGQQVFYSEGYGTPWDGTFKGKQLPVATYYYVIKLENGFKPMTGSVTIIK